MLYLYTYLNVWMSSLKKEEGQGMAEYALIIALVAIVLVAALGTLAGGIQGVFTAIQNAFGVAAPS